MRRLFLSMTVLACAVSINAQNKAALYDSTQVEQLQEVVVKGVRAQKNAPYAVANIKKQQLNEFSKTGKELPILFAQTPGVMAWSENGLGTGTTYMRIRGAGDSRINVTLDGVPLNSPEDQCVFWANMNSYGSLLGSVQIQSRARDYILPLAHLTDPGGVAHPVARGHGGCECRVRVPQERG